MNPSQPKTSTIFSTILTIPSTKNPPPANVTRTTMMTMSCSWKVPAIANTSMKNLPKAITTTNILKQTTPKTSPRPNYVIAPGPQAPQEV
jgi:hypothetical protein